MMISFIKLVHIISAMVYFGLPFTFGRWYGAASASGELQQLTTTVGKIKNFVRIHLISSALVTGATGVYLAVVLGWWQSAWWPHVALLLIILSLANRLFFLLPVLNKVSRIQDMGDRLVTATRIRIAIFSAVRHTLVTLITILMVFRLHL